tara:strand:+ start:225 stop:440 length:216 start_codon:yes stop_codon:yes gene_type:complete
LEFKKDEVIDLFFSKKGGFVSDFVTSAQNEELKKIINGSKLENLFDKNDLSSTIINIVYEYSNRFSLNYIY